jgi:hypothetical protein
MVSFFLNFTTFEWQVAPLFKTEIDNTSLKHIRSKMKYISVKDAKLEVYLCCLRRWTLHWASKQRLIPMAPKLVIRPPRRSFLALFCRYEVLLFSCEIWGKVCYLFHETIHVQQKGTLFHRWWTSIFFFQKAALENRPLFLNFWTGGYQEHIIDRVQKTK